MKQNMLLTTVIMLFSVSGFCQSWLLTGNAGTNAATHFIGTTDAKPLLFKVGGVKSGYLDSATSANTSFGFRTLLANVYGAGNTAVGYKGLSANQSGNYNTTNGYLAMAGNIDGSYNTATGINALTNNISGWYNTATGGSSLTQNKTGVGNSAFGYSSLSSNTASYNAALGFQSLYYNQGGTNNTGAGAFSLSRNVSGNENTAVGSNSLYYNNSGSGNAAIGYQAMYNNTTGSLNVGIGNKALYASTAGSYQVAVGESALMNSVSTTGYNTAIGSKASYTNTTGYGNTSNGVYSLFNNSTGNFNTGQGAYSLYYCTTGSYNIGIGYFALSVNKTGNYNTSVGYMANVNSDNYSNATVLGNGAWATASNQVRIGNYDVSSIGGYQPWSNLSDGRYKKDIQENVPGLAFINKLRPVTYHLDVTGISRHLQQNMTADKNMIGINTPAAYENKEATLAQEKKLSTGFVAQEVEKTAKEMGYEFDGVDAPKNENDFYGLRYSEFVVPLVKAVQELSKQNDELKKEMAELKSLMTAQTMTDGTAKVSIKQEEQTILGQNIPNPADHSTLIPFRIPQGCTDASIAIAESATGRIMRVLPVSCGESQLKLDAGQLVAGNYIYTLYVNGKMIASKQMMVK